MAKSRSEIDKEMMYRKIIAEKWTKTTRNRNFLHVFKQKLGLLRK